MDLNKNEPPTKADVLIVGAGAAGLLAGRELVRAGKTVLILEAKDRTGGRIHTLRDARFSTPVEAGAEFVHGNLPLTLELLREAGMAYEEMEGRTWQVQNGQVKQDENFIQGWSALIAKLKELEHDLSIAAFLEQYFGAEEHRALRESVRKYVEGYDAADTQRASTFALREEWMGEEEAPQYRIPGGYTQLTDALRREIEEKGGRILLSTVVKEIHWRQHEVELISSGGHSFRGRQALITVPLGVWQSPVASPAHLHFSPPLPEKTIAVRELGFGPVIKVLLEFREAFWEATNPTVPEARVMPELGFLFSDASIPTWWSQLPQKTPLLTGWLGGPQAAQLQLGGDEEVLRSALHSLTALFNVPLPFLENQLKASQVINWLNDPFSGGAYTYATVQTPEARKVLGESVENTLFFAGEALYEGIELGTVEAALVSGRDTAQKMLKQPALTQER
jgi:monoamine oxidase